MFNRQVYLIIEAAEGVIDTGNMWIATAIAAAAGICIFIVRHREIFKAKK
jgi:predicted cobalt transporter CbtA